MSLNSSPFEDIAIEDTDRISRLYEGSQALWDRFNYFEDPNNSPLIESFNFDKLTPKRILEINQKGEFDSVQKLGEYITGTGNQVKVIDLGNGRVRLGLYGTFGPGGPIGGAGTVGTIPIWTAFNSLGDSIMTQAAGTVTVAGDVAAANFIAGTLTVTAGSITDSGGSVSFGDDNILMNGGYLEMTEIAAPAGDPAGNKGWVYLKDNAGTSDIYFEDDAGTVHNLVTPPSPPGGADTQVQYNNAGAFGADAGFVTDKAGTQTTSVAWDTAAAGVYKINTTTVLDIAGTNTVLVGPSTISNAAGQTEIYYFGCNIGNAISTGDDLIAIGCNILTQANSGNNSILIGQNIATIGSFAGADNVLMTVTGVPSITTADRNTGLGNRTLLALTSGDTNTCVGFAAGAQITTAGNNTLIGALTGYTGNTSNRTLVGYGLVISGVRNTAVGTNTGVTTGVSNVILGVDVFQASNPSKSVGIGDLVASNAGNDSVYIGYQSARLGSANLQSVVIGSQAGYKMGAGGSVILGYRAAYNNTNAITSVIIGWQAGYGSGSYSSGGNVFIGSQVGYNETGSNLLYIDNSNTTAPLIWGNFASNILRANGVFQVCGTGATYASIAADTGAVSGDTDAELRFYIDGIGIAGTQKGTLAYDQGNDVMTLSYGAIGGYDIQIDSNHDVYVANDLYLQNDSKKIILGAGSDMDMYYDGSDGYLHTDLVAPSDFYVDCGTDKTLELVETVWEDLQFQISSGKVPAANFPSWSVFTTNTKEFLFDVDDYIDLSSNELNHKWKEGTTGNFHLHVALEVAQATGADRFAQFTVYIAYVNATSDWVETSLTAELTIPTGSAAIEAFYLDMGDVSFSGLTIGTQVKCRVKRIAATGGTEYADDIFINQVGCHLEQNTLGSRQEGTK